MGLKSSRSSFIYAGNSTNGLPRQIQGIWWQDGVGLPEEAIGTAGEWNAVEKRLVIHDVRDPVWGYEDSSSVWNGLYWLPSGASHFNLYSLSQAAVEFSFNEVRYCLDAMLPIFRHYFFEGLLLRNVVSLQFCHSGTSGPLQCCVFLDGVNLWYSVYLVQYSVSVMLFVSDD